MAFLIERPTDVIKRKNKNSLRFCHFSVWYLAGVVDAINGPARIAIPTGQQISVHLYLSPSFDEDISLRSVICPMGGHFVLVAILLITSYRRY